MHSLPFALLTLCSCFSLLDTNRSPKEALFVGRTLGVRTVVRLTSERHAHIRVKGLGFERNGTASLKGSRPILSKEFQNFLDARRIRIERVSRIDDHLQIAVDLPIWGRMVVRLLREHELASELGG